MELGSGSLTESGSSKSNPSSPPPPPAAGGDGSFNGLKFGKKIYFEEAKSGHGSSSKSSQVLLGRKVQGGGGGHQQQPPRCQVEGCRVDLSDVKAYYSRHKVCGAHSKSPMVIVNGLEQRFCQQCSRFHQLPEFDQGKRSCRRRLAGHNERRRKPQPGSVLSSQCSQLVSTLSENGSRAGGFLLDFSAYARLPQRDAWPTARSSERLPGIETYTLGRSFPHPWQSTSQNPSSSPCLQNSTAGTGFSSSGIPQGECFTGVSVTDSTCALSLLSNQQWATRNQASSVVVNHSVNAEGTPLEQSAPQHGGAMNQYMNPIWGYRGNEASSSSHEFGPDLGLGQLWLPVNGQFSNELELSHQTRRQYMELEHSRGYGPSTQHMHWSL